MGLLGILSTRTDSQNTRPNSPHFCIYITYKSLYAGVLFGGAISHSTFSICLLHSYSIE
ncbi:hypothetical protein CASFOL_000853 [Castilleja foliolosa]|uniref:Uncharacterized protein n=1 Tax=Castilleja foliolosa TaxID=1961234 RepID=A0ABD3EKW0_9LAMI